MSNNKHTVYGHNGTRYECIGYENRGLFSVPVAEVVNGECIQCEVYEITHGMWDDDPSWNVSIFRPNATELTLLASVGWQYNGAFASRL